jgi:hypothetical protein
VIEVYNNANKFQSGLCDPWGRQVESVSALIVDFDAVYPLGEEQRIIEGNNSNSHEAAVLLEISLGCLGCGDLDATAFDLAKIGAPEEAENEGVLYDFVLSTMSGSNIIFLRANSHQVPARAQSDPWQSLFDNPTRRCQGVRRATMWCAW